MVHQMMQELAFPFSMLIDIVIEESQPSERLFLANHCDVIQIARKVHRLKYIKRVYFYKYFYNKNKKY